MPLNITITDAGRAEVINATNTGTRPVTLTEVGLGSGMYAPSAEQTALVSETKRVSTISGEAVAADTIHVTVLDDSGDVYDVSEFGLYTDKGTLFAVYSDASGAFMQKTAASKLLLAVDIVLGTLDATSLTFGNTNFSMPPASETVQGVLKLSTQTQALDGADDSTAMSPKKVHAAFRKFGLGGNAGSITNIDTITKSGFYTCGVGTIGTEPPDGILGNLLHIERGSSNQATQLFDTLRSAGQEQKLYTRTRNNSGVWTVWVGVTLGGAATGGGDGRFNYLAAGDGTPDVNSIPSDDRHWLEVSNNPGDGAAGQQLFRMNSYGNIAYGNNIHSCRYFGDESAPAAIQNGAYIMSWGFRGYDGTELAQSAGAFQYQATENWNSSAHGAQFAWETTPNGSTARSRRMVLDPDGNLLVGMTSNTYHALAKTVAEGDPLLLISNNSNGSVWYSANGGGSNAAAASLRINKNSTTGRSINAAGTVNASGADYAEYMRKSDGCGDIAKGDIVGIDANGELTDQFSLALSFAVKSTDPSYVGGDVWGCAEALGIVEPVQPVLNTDDLLRDRDDAVDQARSELLEARASVDQQELDDAAASDALKVALDTFNRSVAVTVDTFNTEMASRNEQYLAEMNRYKLDLESYQSVLEAERQRWDRVAFSGRVPVNVTDAAAGDYLVPVDDGNGGVKAIAVASPSFDQYLLAVGKVVAIGPDGRPIVIVKVV